MGFDPFGPASRITAQSRSRSRQAEVARSMDSNAKRSIDALPPKRPAVFGLLSRTGPEAPPDLQWPLVPKVAGRGPAGPPPQSAFRDEPTQRLPLIAGRPRDSAQIPPAQIPPATPTRPAPPKVQARTVIVYEPEPRRSWGLWAFTAILVSLTVGVVLGQTVADVPRTASASVQPAPVDAGFSTPPSPAPSPSSQVEAPQGAPGQRVTAPLGKARSLRFEVSGGATVVTVRSADLGDRLFDIAALDDSAAPRVVSLKAGPRLTFVPTGRLGRIGAVIQLSSRVKWNLILAGGAAEQDIDMRAGGLAGLDLAGGASRTLVRLPAPSRTVPLTVSGAVGELDVQAGKDIPVRVKLGKGADYTAVDGTARTTVKSGTTLASAGWSTATNRYDISAPAKLGILRIDHP